jgi:HEAT repeat protein
MKLEDKQRVISALESNVEEIRYRACQRLPEVFEQLPIEYLMKSLADESWRVRKLACGILTDAEVSDDLLDALVVALSEDENAGLRNSACEVLTIIGSPALEHLFAVLKKGDKDERKLVVDILGDIGDPSAVQVLIDTLVDKDENVRSAAAEALGMIGDENVVDRLVEVLQDDSLLVQLSCLDALTRLNALVPVETLRSLLSISPLRPNIYRLLANHQIDSVTQILVEGLQARGRQERAAAAQSIAEQYRRADKQMRVDIHISVARTASDQVVEQLRAMLKSSVDEDRQAAAMILGWTGRTDVIRDLLEVSSDEKLRQIVFESIISIGPKSGEVICELLGELKRDEKILAVEILGHFGTQSSLSWIVDLSLSEDPEVSGAAQRSLASVGNETIIDKYVQILSKTDSIPYAAVSSLTVLGLKFHDQVVSAIKTFLSDDNQYLRIAAVEILCGVAKKTDLDDILRLVGDEDEDVRVAAISALGKVGGENAVDKLRMALVDESAKVRAAAARALGCRDNENAKTALKVAINDSDPWVVIEALVAIGQSGFSDMAELVLPLVNHNNGAVALEAIKTLNRLEWQGDIDWFVQASRHPDPEVVKEVLAGCERWSNDDVRQILINALGDSQWDVRTAAVRKIGVSKDALAIQAVFERYKVEEDDLVKESMEQILEVNGLKKG